MQCRNTCRHASYHSAMSSVGYVLCQRFPSATLCWFLAFAKRVGAQWGE